METFAVGDVVALKSGGPRMTITGTSPNRTSGKQGYDVVFADSNGSIQYGNFPGEVLEKAISGGYTRRN